jgi:hypothetical protein
VFAAAKVRMSTKALLIEAPTGVLLLVLPSLTAELLVGEGISSLKR